MNENAIERLRQCVLGDDSLQERLRAIGDHDEFVSAALELARELDLDLTADELDMEMNNAQRAWLLRWM